ERIIEEGADRVLGINKEDGAHRRRVADGFMHHAESLSDLLIKIGNNREWNLDVKLLLDVAHPGDVRVNAVNGDADRLNVEPLEFLVVTRELDELCGAHRREVRGMREEQHPFALTGVIAQFNDPMC